MKWFWLSFADGTLPRGSQFLGAAVVAAHDLPGAIRVAWALGINPGGEVQIAEIENLPPPEYRERLLSREQIAEMERVMES